MGRVCVDEPFTDSESRAKNMEKEPPLTMQELEDFINMKTGISA